MNEGRMTLRAWAKSRRIPLSTAHKAIKSGRVHRGEDGRLDPKRADVEFEATRRLQITSAHRRDGPVETAYATARIRKDVARAKILQLKIDELERTLIPVADVRAQLFEASSVLTRHLRRLPDRIARRVVDLSEIEPCRLAIREEVGRILLELRAVRIPGTVQAAGER